MSEPEPCVVRQRMLGTEALYRVISDDGAVVTAEVLEAPGLERGMRLRLMARAVRAMERLDLHEAFAARGALDPAVVTVGAPIQVAR